VHDGLVFIGISSDEQNGYRGGIRALDSKNGAIRWRFEVDPILDGNGHVILNRDGLALRRVQPLWFARTSSRSFGKCRANLVRGAQGTPGSGTSEGAGLVG
jgi:hypothetical protein